MSKVFVFPGQGSQKIGMGKSLAENFSVAKETFDMVDDALGEKLSLLIWDGEIEQLTLTENAQPALMATSMATLAVLESEGFNLNTLSFMAGHSLGEYSALCAAKAISIGDTARLLRIRGKAMQQSVKEGQGAMAAILGLQIKDVELVIDEVCSKYLDKSCVCQIANDNDPNQVVISGTKELINHAIVVAKRKGAKRAIILNVSAPFHCDLMTPAAIAMQNALENIIIKTPKIPVVMNITASSVLDPLLIKENLIKQVTGIVKWRESVNFMLKNEATEFYEIGVGKVLSGMIRRISLDTITSDISTSEDITNYLGNT
jgi:[acyl-carrier-protein] S-malonyltransferase